MKLIIAAEIYSPDIGGPATYSNELAEELAKRSWKVKIICYSTEVHNDNKNFSVIRILRSQKAIQRYSKYCWYLFLHTRFSHLIYAQGPVSSGLPSIIVGFLLRKKVVVKVTGDYAWEQARNFDKTSLGIDEFQGKKFKGKIGWLQKIESWVCRRADTVIVPSNHLKTVVTGWGVDQDKINVIYNSFDPKITIEKKKIDPNLIVSVGRLVPWKGFEALISIMPELLKVNPEFKLVIFGDGPRKDELTKLIDQLDLKDKVLIPGRVSHEGLMQMLHCGVFVLNTGYEGLSHTILEAFTAGVPVVTTKIGGNLDVVTDNENGLLIEYNNKEQLKEAILKLYDNQDLRQKFIDNSKKVLDKFSFEGMINKTMNILKITNK